MAKRTENEDKCKKCEWYIPCDKTISDCVCYQNKALKIKQILEEK
jgi:hypothetical protein